MIKYHKNGVTLLLFTTFKFRLMGPGQEHRQILKEFLTQLPWIASVGEMTVNMTVSHQLPDGVHVNLWKLEEEAFQKEMELFPAAKLIHEGREHVNVFHSGHIVITGVRDLNRVEPLLDRVIACIQPARYW